MLPHPFVFWAGGQRTKEWAETVTLAFADGIQKLQPWAETVTLSFSDGVNALQRNTWSETVTLAFSDKVVKKRTFGDSFTISLTEAWAKTATPRIQVQAWSETVTLSFSDGVSKTTTFATKTWSETVTLGFSDGVVKARTFGDSFTISLSEAWALTKIKASVTNVSIAEINDGSTTQFTAEVTFDAGDNTESVKVQYREWDETDTEITSGWTDHETVDVTPGGTGYKSSRDAGGQCHWMQFRLIPYTGDSASGTAGDSVDTAKTQLNNNGGVLC